MAQIGASGRRGEVFQIQAKELIGKGARKEGLLLE